MHKRQQIVNEIFYVDIEFVNEDLNMDKISNIVKIRKCKITNIIKTIILIS